ncbi:MAG: hypothetical protein AAF288_12565 [Planctomycetota bacterium]
MPGERHGLALGHASPLQVRDERVTKRVEVGLASMPVFFGDARLVEVSAPRVMARHPVRKDLSGASADFPQLIKQRSRLRGQRQNVGSLSLCICRPKTQQAGVQVYVSPLQFTQFAMA